MEKYENVSEVGAEHKIKNMQDIGLKFILVVKNADITWLAGPMAELKQRLRKFSKIWGIQVAVLNEELAGQFQLTC